mmetsp:Transcript_15725/g.19065  ORF Transcript_15725/g.19065 Transcript_15725/m.19065 type:complete len:335 (-) Transcript_15725:340-1344(-)
MSTFDLDFSKGHETTKVHAFEFWRTIVDLGRTSGRPDDLSTAGPFPWEMCIELSVIFFILNWAIRLLLVEPAFKSIVAYARPEFYKKKKKLRGVTVKFAQACMEMISYGSFAYFGVIILRSQDWIWPHELWWADQPDNSYMTRDLIFFYVAYCSRYIQAFLSVFLETARKDFWEMQIHHVVTIGLVIGSYEVGLTKIGVIIMVLMDLSDPLLQLGKQILYLKEILKTGLVAKFLGWFTDTFFGVFVALFTGTRMVIYPFAVSTMYTDYFSARNGILNATFPEITLFVLLCVLQVLQVIWFTFLCSAVYRVVTGKQLGDTRSDSDASDVDRKKNE